MENKSSHYERQEGYKREYLFGFLSCILWTAFVRWPCNKAFFGLSENALFALYTIKPQVSQFKINLPPFTRRAVRIITLMGKIFVDRLKGTSNLLESGRKEGEELYLFLYISFQSL